MLDSGFTFEDGDLLLIMADNDDEVLREAACVGNMDSVRKLVQMGASVNSQNIVNGW